MAKKKLEVVEIPIDKIVPNTWNPNVMDDETFNRLAEEIQDVGMIDPIQVVPIEGEEEKYMILGGEHRWRVMKVLGYETIPCIVLTDEKFHHP
jgi:ParB family chromosome partitioning protein